MAPSTKTASKKKQQLKFVIDCHNPVDDKIMDISQFVRFFNQSTLHDQTDF
jgi:hypothetical protein